MSRAHELFARLEAGGEAAIDELISDFQSENLWVDFKRSADQGSGSRLHQADRENLAKAISGFANSDGGVIVWGVDCRKEPTTGADLPSGKFPIKQPKRFVSWLEGAISSCVTPPVSHLFNAVLATSEDEGFVVTYIPASELTPHQCIQPSTRLQYYMRAGSSFIPVPHAVLAGMFGRRPQPQISTICDGHVQFVNETVLDISLGVRVVNHGPAPANGAYLTFRILTPRSHCRVSFKPRSPECWSPYQAYDMFYSVTALDTFRLPPHMPVQPVQFKFQFEPPFVDSYLFELHAGCDGAVVTHTFIEKDCFEVSRAYADTMELLKSKTSAEALPEIFSCFFGQNFTAA
jgi:hypothetical protein